MSGKDFGFVISRGLAIWIVLPLLNEIYAVYSLFVLRTIWIPTAAVIGIKLVLAVNLWFRAESFGRVFGGETPTAPSSWRDLLLGLIGVMLILFGLSSFVGSIIQQLLRERLITSIYNVSETDWSPYAVPATQMIIGAIVVVMSYRKSWPPRRPNWLLNPSQFED